MKKRSLVASIAMLLVSAIVLSTSTYAWFSAGAAVSVGEITATIQETDGSIKVCATNSQTESDWGDTLSTAAIQAVSTYSFPEYISPISCQPAATPTFISGSLTSSESNGVVTQSLATGTNVAGKYTKYSFFLKAGAAGTRAQIVPAFTTTLNYVMGLVVVGDQSAVFSANNTITYNPITNNNTTLTDTDKDGIISTTEGSSSVGSAVTTGGTSMAAPFQVTFASTTDVKQVDVYIWAEGQQASCTGSPVAGTASFSFTANTVSGS